MGTFTKAIQVGDLDSRQFVEIEALVDTGATHTAIPKSMLAEVGVEIERWHAFELADDRLVEYGIGHAKVRLDGMESIVTVVFVPDDVSPLLGATTLEDFGLAVDPMGRRLVPERMLLK